MKRFYEDVLKTSENRLPQRAYYIPEGKAEYQLLNGIWDFIYFENGDAARDFSSWNKIDVPSCWQARGFENPNYTNVNYPYPVDIPYVPDINPMGAYRRKFNITDKNKKHYFVFDGVASCAQLYINGLYVGFTTGNHLQSEFDITDYVNAGENEVLVKVYKWAVTSYIEDQDFFRFNGIFRDVYVLSRPKNHIRDIRIETEENDILIETDNVAEVSLYYKDTLLEKKTIDKKGTFTVENPKKWTAETPELYKLVFSCNGEIISQNVGFRKIEIIGDVLYLNGQNIKIKGVNHHDTNSNDGWSMTRDELLTDLLLMKKLNINAVRTSHYPPHPEFLNMCDELGFYVILETDMEAHGMARAKPNAEYGKEWISDIFPCRIPEWKKEHVERMQRAYHRDKNHPSIIMWSIGNEASFGENHIAMVEWLRETDKKRPVHSEDACRLDGLYEKFKGYKNYSDVYSRMYPAVTTVKEFVEDKEINMPIYLCEYSHAMGNGPGDVWDYWELFYDADKCAGGCVWEWADHTVLVDGVPKYGGDFEGELTHDGNFCCDGLVKHDRTFKAGSYEVRAAYAPFRITVEGNKVKYKNYYDFLDLDGYKIKYSVIVDGKVYSKGEIKEKIMPRETIEFTVDMPKTCKYAAVVSVALFNGKEEVAVLEKKLDVEKIKEEKNGELCELFEDDLTIYANGENFKYAFSKQTGNLISMVVNGNEILEKPVYLSLMRAVTDNDRNVAPFWLHYDGWRGENLNKAFPKCYDAYIEDGVIKVKGSVAGVSRRPVIKYDMVLSVFADGRIHTDFNGVTGENAPFLPRLGFEYIFKKKNASFEYFGYGPMESYCDSMHHASLSRYKSTAKKEYVEYIKPQEHGNHTNTLELIIDGVKFTPEKPMDINVSQYSANQLYEAKHIDELPENKCTFVHIDYKNSGLGSNSCGPWLIDKYQLNEKEIHFEYDMEILK